MEKKEVAIGEKLKNLRRVNCLSQEGLAGASGVSLRTIQRIEEGKSNGSAFTLTALAKALNINSIELITSASENTDHTYSTNKLKLLNFSAMAMVLIPLANLGFPVYIYLKNREDESVKDIGGKIISFQFFWTLGTFLAAIIIPFILLLLFSALKAASIPLFVPVYFVSAFLNIYFVIQFAININRQTPFLTKIPNIL